MSCNCGSCISCENLYSLPLGTNGADGADGADGAQGAGYGGEVPGSLVDLSSLPALTNVTADPGLAYEAGARVRLSDQGDLTRYFEGIVQSYNPTTGFMVIDNIDVVSGTGIAGSWFLNLAGEKTPITELSRVLHHYGGDSSVSGPGEQTLDSYVMPAGTMSNNFDTLVIESLAKEGLPGLGPISATQYVNLKFGTHYVATYNLGPNTDKGVFFKAKITRIANTTIHTVVEIWNTQDDFFNVTSQAINLENDGAVVPDLDVNPITIEMTGDSPGGEEIRLDYWRVDIIKNPS